MNKKQVFFKEMIFLGIFWSATSCGVKKPPLPPLEEPQQIQKARSAPSQLNLKKNKPHSSSSKETQK